jgi:hypothetical protein
MKSILITAVVLFGMFPALALGQFEKGDSTFTLSGTGSGDKDLNDASGAAEFSLSTFATKELEIGLRQAAFYSDGFSGSTSAFVDFNIPLGQFVPFVGLSTGFSYGEDVDDGWTIGPEAGLKYFIAEDVFLFARAAYGFDATEGFSDGGFSYGLGIGCKW